MDNQNHYEKSDGQIDMALSCILQNNKRGYIKLGYIEINNFIHPGNQRNNDNILKDGHRKSLNVI